MIVLDYRDSRPLYQQVKDSLRRMMLTGLLEPDEKLPSVRSLATQLAINPNTIQRAYAELEAEGYRVVAGINGDFYNGGTTTALASGLPIGPGQTGRVTLSLHGSRVPPHLQYFYDHKTLSLSSAMA